MSPPPPPPQFNNPAGETSGLNSAFKPRTDRYFNTNDSSYAFNSTP